MFITTLDESVSSSPFKTPLFTCESVSGLSLDTISALLIILIGSVAPEAGESTFALYLKVLLAPDAKFVKLPVNVLAVLVTSALETKLKPEGRASLKLPAVIALGPLLITTTVYSTMSFGFTFILSAVLVNSKSANCPPIVTLSVSS